MKTWTFAMPDYLSEPLNAEEKNAIAIFCSISEAYYLANKVGEAEMDAMVSMCLKGAFEKGDLIEASICGWHKLAEDFISNHDVENDPEFVHLLHTALHKVIEHAPIRGAAIAMRFICDLPSSWQLPIRLRESAEHAMDERMPELEELLWDMCDDDEEFERARNSYRKELVKLINNEDATAGTA